MNLQTYIEYEVSMAGGRIKLAYQLMQENQTFFTYREIQDMKDRLSKQLSRDKKKSGVPHKCKWTKEDLKYLKENWGLIPSSKVAKELDRTLPSLRQKFRSQFGEYEYKKRVSEGLYGFIRKTNDRPIERIQSEEEKNYEKVNN